MPGLYLNIVFENPAFRIACACALLHSLDFLRDDNKSRSISRLLKNIHRYLLILGVCNFISTLNGKLILWLFVTYRLWPVLVQIIVGFGHRSFDGHLFFFFFFKTSLHLIGVPLILHECKISERLFYFIKILLQIKTLGFTVKNDLTGSHKTRLGSITTIYSLFTSISLYPE